jgi:ribosomal protein S18 acetylase RimI-like enzyme
VRVTYRELTPAQFRASLKELVAVYAAAMNSPDQMLAGREAIMERHAASPGFRALTALADGRLAGFTYGFHGQGGQWWHDVVAGALAAGPRVPLPPADATTPGTPSPATGWLDDSYEIAELHVLPRWQGMGIGRSLLLSLASGRPERTAVLSTADAPTRARRLYRSVGFTDLLTGFRFSGIEPPYAVMGACLPLPSPQDAEPAGSTRLPRPSNS